MSDTSPQSAAYFTDNMIEAISNGLRPLKPDERAWLIEEGVRMEECWFAPTEERPDKRTWISEMDDAELMRTLYAAWVDYCR